MYTFIVYTPHAAICLEKTSVYFLHLFEYFKLLCIICVHTNTLHFEIHIDFDLSHSKILQILILNIWNT